MSERTQAFMESHSAQYGRQEGTVGAILAYVVVGSLAQMT